MPLEIAPLTRVFKYNGVELPDINPSLSIDQVRDLHAGTYPELANAKIHTEVKQGQNGVQHRITTFNVAVGTKG